MIQEKKCKGTGKAKSHGCGELVPVVINNRANRVYGLGKSCGCYTTWLICTEEGSAVMKKAQIIGKKKFDAKEKKDRREKKNELDEKGAMRLADMYFSRFIRVLHSIDGECTCYTCGAVKDIKEVDNGHYQKRKDKATRYHENNCRPQCKTCNGNTAKNGMQDVFRVHLANEIGENEVVEIENLARTTIKANSLFYRDIADKYRVKGNELQRKLKIKIW